MASSERPKLPAQGYYQCTECQRSYSRVDHLARHVRSHMQEKPFECQVCKKCFGRPDLLKRHALNHDGESSEAKRLKRQHGQTSRVSSACKACASAKLKCEETKPCKRCQHKNIPCESGIDNRLRHPESLNDSQISPSRQISQALISDGSQTIGQPTSLQNEMQSTTTYSDLPVTNAPNAAQYPAFDETYFSDFLKDVLMPPGAGAYVSISDWQTQPASYRNILDFTNGDAMGYYMDDFSFLDAFDNNSPMTDIIDPAIGSTIAAQTKPPSDPRKRAGLGAEVFKSSLFSRWTPGAHDHSQAEHRNLLLKDVDSREARITTSTRVTAEKVQQTSRDKILAMVIETYKGPSITSVIGSFPSTDLLDDLLQLFLQHHITLIDPWLHVPTFSVRKQRAELLGAMIASGGIMTGIEPLQRFGDALQEVVRLALARRCEENNSNTREIGILQAFVLDLQLGIWSRRRRKREIAESLVLVIMTMLRRGGRFERQRQPPNFPTMEDHGDALDAMWREWAHYESLKRVTYQAYLHSARTSIAVLVSPVVSYAELNLQLPCSQTLWNAKSAEQWKKVFLEITCGQPLYIPSATDCLLDPSPLASAQHICDIQLSGIIVLHGIYGMVWEYLQMKTLSRTTSCLVTGSRHQDLVQILTRFRLAATTGWNSRPSPEIKLLLELLSLYLHMSLEDIQLFAGKEDKDEARRVLPSLLEWVDSPSARQAMWHAGQVLQAARAMDFTHIRDFYAIAVYHTSLAFWAYGLISNARSSRITGGDYSSAYPGHSPQPVIILDQIDSPDIQRFIQLGHGNPHITRFAPGPVPMPLSNPEDVMCTVVEAIEENWRCTKGGFPLTMLENLTQLMRGLGVAAGQMQT